MTYVRTAPPGEAEAIRNSTAIGLLLASVPLAEAVGRCRLVPLDCDLVQTAREMGVCLGDN